MDMSGVGNNIVVNRFMFCKQHGSEFCHRCMCDHRLGNNHIGDLYEVFRDLLLEADFDLEERMSLNAYGCGAVPMSAGSEDYKCTAHNKRDCGRCFDWAGIIRREIG